MKQSKIKTECKSIYDQIEALNNRLIEIRSICKHPNTKEGNYSNRISSTVPATICSDCGEVISTEWEKLAEINSEEI